MKSEYTRTQLSALAALYRRENAKYQARNAEAEELLSEGSYVQRERVLREAWELWQVMRGIRAAAEAVGIPEETFFEAVNSEKGM